LQGQPEPSMTDHETQEVSALQTLTTRLHSYPISKRLTATEVGRVRRELFHGSSTEYNGNPNVPYKTLMATLEERAQSILRWVRSADTKRAQK
jgi:hypothetical protein